MGREDDFEALIRRAARGDLAAARRVVYFLESKSGASHAMVPKPLLDVMHEALAKAGAILADIAERQEYGSGTWAIGGPAYEAARLTRIANLGLDDESFDVAAAIREYELDKAAADRRRHRSPGGL